VGLLGLSDKRLIRHDFYTVKISLDRNCHNLYDVKIKSGGSP
jgi:hypothetical protein